MWRCLAFGIIFESVNVNLSRKQTLTRCKHYCKSCVNSLCVCCSGFETRLYIDIEVGVNFVK